MKKSPVFQIKENGGLLLCILYMLFNARLALHPLWYVALFPMDGVEVHTQRRASKDNGRHCAHYAMCLLEQKLHHP